MIKVENSKGKAEVISGQIMTENSGNPRPSQDKQLGGRRAWRDAERYHPREFKPNYYW